MPDWGQAREQMMLAPDVTNLNTGSWGPTPKPVFERVTELRRHQACEPMDFILRTTPPLLRRARTRLAEFLNSDPKCTIFTQNVSTAINIVASGLSSEAPGEILMSDREYGCMHWCWERAARRQGLAIKTFHLPLMPSSPGEIAAAVEAAITPQTRLLFFSHVYSATGIVVPARDLCGLARQRGVISVVDGAHAPAQIDLSVDDIDADFYAGNLHKWLLAPTGAGFLVLGRNSLDRLEPLQVSWGYGHKSSSPDEPDEHGSTPRIRALEFEGTRDICPWLVVPDALDFQQSLGFNAIKSRMAELSEHARKRLEGLAGLRLTTPGEVELRGAMTAFWTEPEPASNELRERLWKNRIEVPVMDWPDGRIVRISTHFYNTMDEIDRFAAIVPELFS
ncbi:MAG: aminotransferase class V-fold PLP-dependent enzyme [Gemmataceae bacterium]